MKNNIIYLLAFLFLGVACENSNTSEETGIISIIPQPVKIEQGSGFFQIDKNTVIVTPDNKQIEEVAQYLNAYFNIVSGNDLELISTEPKKNCIVFKISDGDDLGNEGYKLSVTNKKIMIEAVSSRGLFYGIQTVLQLLPIEIFSQSKVEHSELKIPVCEIFDKPRFSWRGMHLDVGRHYFPVAFIKKYIDLIALHKMNTFHWHLTEDQGWRIEIKKYPELTTIGSKRKETILDKNFDPFVGDGIPYGGYYTQEEVREIVEYARQRQITVIPEIEMPGHSLGALAAYPELGCTGGPYEVSTIWGVKADVFCAGNDDVFNFLENVLTEVMQLFPSQYIHIGGDECPKERWEKCEKCQARIKTEGLKNEHELQSYFIKRIESFLNANGRDLIGWDEILEGGLAPNAAVMSWRGIKGGIEAAEQGHDVVMTPTSHCYFDYYQANPDFEPLAIGGFTSLKKVYSFEPVPAELDKNKVKYILGAQGNVWTEYMKTPEYVEYMAVPRMTALAEVLWSPREFRDWDSFQHRLVDQKKRFDFLDVNYSQGSWKVDIVPVLKDGSYEITLESEQLYAPIYYTLDGSEPSNGSQLYDGSFTIEKSTAITAGIFLDGQLKEDFSVKEIVFHKAVGKTGKLEIDPNPAYYCKGAFSLTDGLLGSEQNQSEYWLGFEGSDLSYEVDLEEDQIISSVYANFLQRTASWILMPKNVTFEILSKDKKLIFKKTVEPEATLEVKGTVIEAIGVEPNLNGRYIKVHAKNYKTLPSWHKWTGNKSWLFVDELIVN